MPPFPFGLAALQQVSGGWVNAGLGQGDAVQGGIELPVPGSRQPMPQAAGGPDGQPLRGGATRSTSFPVIGRPQV